jgi:hypothetical protein
MSIVLHQAQGPAPCSGRKLGARAHNSPVKISPRGHSNGSGWAVRVAIIKLTAIIAHRGVSLF